MGEGLVISERDTTFNLMGRKDPTQVFHCCDTCRLPIVTYGRMIPCKHVFCFNCSCQSRKTGGSCARCNDTVQRIEKCPRGTVFVCRIQTCRRTYLSNRDLTAHIKHRHKKNEAQAMGRQIMPIAQPGQPSVQASTPVKSEQVNTGHPGAPPSVLHHGQTGGFQQGHQVPPQQYGNHGGPPTPQQRRGPPPASAGDAQWGR